MNSYRVNVVVSFSPDFELFAHFAALPTKAPGMPDIETSAVDIVLNDDVTVPPLRQTLTASYDVEGRDVDEARRFAMAIYARDAEKLSLP